MLLTVTLNASVDKLYLLEKNTLGTVMRVRETRNSAGGKGINLSRVAAQLGESVTAMGFVGGHTGQYFEALLTQQGITHAFTPVAAEMRNCINCWDLSLGQSTEYLETGSPVTEQDANRFLEDFALRLPTAQVVSISGSLPRGLRDDFYATLVRLCHHAQRPVLLDASGSALGKVLPAEPDLIKPNMDELEALLGHCPQTFAEKVDAVRALHQGGISCATLSLGADGVLLACAEGVYHGLPPRTKPKNTVGCGDSMMAGFAVGLARGLPIVERIRLAVAVATSSALAIGTGEYADEDLQAILPQVMIHQL